jgi:hypothetical protein
MGSGAGLNRFIGKLALPLERRAPSSDSGNYRQTTLLASSLKLHQSASTSLAGAPVSL